MITDDDNECYEICHDCGQPTEDCCCGYEEDNGDDDICPNCGEDTDDCTCSEDDNCPDCGESYDDCTCGDDNTCPDCGEDYDDCYCDDEDLHKSNIKPKEDEILKFINVKLTNISATIKVKGSSVIFKVTNQNEATRNFKKLAFYNDFAIQGIDYPRIEKNKILLRGKMTFNDEHESSYQMNSEDEAIAYADGIHKALRFWDKELSPESTQETSQTVVAPTVETKPPEATEQQRITIEHLKAFMTQQRETTITKTSTGGFTFS